VPAGLEEDSARRPARIPPAEDWLRTAAVKDRIAGFLRAARPLGAWLEQNVGRSATGGQGRVSRALSPQMSPPGGTPGRAPRTG